jgi:hypothetical protein
MKAATFGSATVESGANKGKARFLSFQTGIKPENSNGLPVKDGKTYANVSPADIPTFEFENVEEVQQHAGEHFNTLVVEWANDAVLAKYRAALTTNFRKLDLPPTSIADFVKSTTGGITPESVLIPAVAGPKKIATASLIELANRTDLSDAEKLAMIRALAGI